MRARQLSWATLLTILETPDEFLTPPMRNTKIDIAKFMLAQDFKLNELAFQAKQKQTERADLFAEFAKIRAANPQLYQLRSRATLELAVQEYTDTSSEA